MTRDAQLEVHQHLVSWAETHAPEPSRALALFMGTPTAIAPPVLRAARTSHAAKLGLGAKVLIAASLVGMSGAAAVGIASVASSLSGDPAPPPAVTIPFGSDPSTAPATDDQKGSSAPESGTPTTAPSTPAPVVAPSPRHHSATPEPRSTRSHEPQPSHEPSHEPRPSETPDQTRTSEPSDRGDPTGA
jgi:hypothetical protein